MKYYVDINGRFLGGWDDNPPTEAVEVPFPPEDARMVWNGSTYLTTQEVEREQFKEARAKAVASITVETTSSRIFDGDEISQGRMARAILGLQEEPSGTTLTWVLADNSVVQVGLAELKEALKLAGLRQTELWTAP